MEVITSQTNKVLKRIITRCICCNYLLFLPEGYSDSKHAWPLILFLHGARERGDDLNLVKQHGLAKLVETHINFPFIVVSPQCPHNSGWDTSVLTALLDEIEGNYRVDENRIYVTGLSMGGYGTWQLALETPHRFAAIAPIGGGSNPLLAHRIKHLPIWAFHGAKGKVVPIVRSREMVRALSILGAPVQFTVYPNAMHDSWTQTYENVELYDWLLKQRRIT